MKLEKYIDIDGCELKIQNHCLFKIYFKNGLTHRLGGPAIEFSDGLVRWYKEDKVHRIGGPAIYSSDRNIHWCVNGKQVDIYYICG